MAIDAVPISSTLISSHGPYLSPEDSQELMEKMLDLLVQRSRFEAALEIARRARKTVKHLGGRFRFAAAATLFDFAT